MSLARGDLPILKIYGERNTGTNYLSQLIALNLNAELLPGSVPRWLNRILQHMPGKEHLKDVYFRYTFPGNLGWKHAKVLPVPQLKQQPLASQVRFITLTKNPYSWLLSLYKRPYALRSPRAADFESFVTSPWRTVGRENTTAILPSPVHLWNEKNASYMQLDNHFPVVRVRYEDLLVNPEETIEQVSSTLKIDKRLARFVNLEQSTKRDASTFSDYQQYYLQEQWRKNLSPAVINVINSMLDMDVVRHYGYAVLAPATAESRSGVVS